MENSKDLEKFADNKSCEAEKKEKGASLVEYSLLAALIAIVCIVAMRTLGKKASMRFSQIASAVAMGE